MIRRVAVLFIASCLLTISSLVISADDKPFRISSTVTKSNEYPRLAVDGDRGNVLVVWAQSDQNDSDCGRIYAVFCKRNKKGGFKIKSPFVLSPNQGRHANPDVAFDSSKKRFLVVWDTWQEEEGWQMIMAPSKLFGRFVSRTGKAAGPVITVVDENRNDSFPLLRYKEAGEAPAGIASFFLLWNRYTVNWGDREQIGLYAGMLNSSGQLASPTKRVLKGKWEDDSGGSTGKLWYFAIYPEDGVYCPQGSFLW